MPVPTPPTQVSLTNLYIDSDHPDVATFQAAMVRTLNMPIPITGVYDTQTQLAVRNTAAMAREIDPTIELRTGNGGTVGRVIPNGNFVRMVGLSLR